MDSGDKFYVDLVGQIMDGFSEFQWGGRSLYIKHHKLKEQAKIPRFFESYKEDAIRRGIPTEEDAIKEAVERGDWSDKDEEFVLKTEARVKALSKAAEQMVIPSQKEAQMKIVEGEVKKLKEKKEERSCLLEFSAENISYEKTNNRFMEEIIFKDKELTELLLEGEDCSTQDFFSIRVKQAGVYNRYKDDNISKAVLMDFFSPFLPFSESPMDLFGKPAAHLTVFQLKLITYSRLFFNIFKNYQDIPNMIRYDPEAILRFVESKSKDDGSTRHSTAKTEKKDNSATTYFGANKDDIGKLKASDEKVVSLSDEVKKHGGRMTMEQMMKMMGDGE
jgi:hypothetical protein